VKATAVEEFQYLSQSKGVCRECKKIVEVRYVSANGEVFLERHCPDHPISRALVAESLSWFLDAMKAPIAARPPEKVIERTGECPTSCGPCQFHAQRCNLPVFSITNLCDLNCPICFTYNREDKAYNMSPEEFERHIDFVVEATGGVDLVNITGGEPTRHPQLIELLERARRPEIGRITVNTNGLTIARDPFLAQELARVGAYVILSFDTLEPQISQQIHGLDLTKLKLQALDNLEKAGVQCTLLMVLIGGVNEHELGDILDLALTRKHVRSLTIQTMAYTGQGGSQFGPRRHIPVDGVERRLAEASNGRLQKNHFFPLPTAHPLCYGVGYFLQDEDSSLHSFSELLDKNLLAEHLSEGYLLRPSDALEQALKEAIDRLWAEGGSDALLGTLKHMLKTMYPTGKVLDTHERQRRAEKSIKTIYVHAHMDEDTYEVGRAMRCPDQVPVDAERLIGACNYNLFYRMKDDRFWVQS